MASAHHSRRAALRGLGLAGVATGVRGALGAPGSRAQTWTGTPPQPTATSAASSGGPAAPAAASSGGSFQGVAGGLPPFATNLETTAPQVHPAGDVRWGNQAHLPVLQGVAIASERIEPNAVRELHWHLNAHDLSYVLTGQGRMGVFSSDGTGETFDIQPGSITFVPNGYTHYIQNTGEDTLHLVLAFTHEQPETTDLAQALPSFPQSLLAQTFGVSAADFPFLTTGGDRQIVPLPAAQSDIGVATPVVATTSQYSVHADQVELKEFIGQGGSARPVSTKNIPALEGITLYLLHIVAGGLREPHWHPNTSELSYCVRGRHLGQAAGHGRGRRARLRPPVEPQCGMRPVRTNRGHVGSAVIVANTC